VVEKIYVSLGNAGTELLEKCENITLSNHQDLLQFALKNKIDLTVVGPEQPLVEGIVDLFKKHNLSIFGPSANGAILEGSKIFAKDFMKRYRVATATYETFDKASEAIAYVQKNNKYPIVIKADGLAAGKGVEICKNLEQAKECIQLFVTDNIFKNRDPSIVIEEYLTGVEASIICVTDGKTILPLISSQDHKTIFENNQGPNTGGMGAVCPNQHVNKQVMDDFIKNIMKPTMNGIIEEHMDFHGFVFFGVMITKSGCKCLEYNVRMGDPECQSIIPLMDFDLVKMIQATIDNKLDTFQLK
jgi:phosphoribosylamine--glycine ligase